jgi:hypothetical protein
LTKEEKQKEGAKSNQNRAHILPKLKPQFTHSDNDDDDDNNNNNNNNNNKSRCCSILRAS